MSKADSKEGTNKPFSILSLDGGGSKGAFTLGVLKALEEDIGPLSKNFDIVYGTSTGAIIAAYVALGFSIDQIYKNYLAIIPQVMSKRTANGRSAALESAAYREFGNHTFADARIKLAIVATRCDEHRPLIFKSHPMLAHSGGDDFVAGFGVPLADCLLASAAASPFFVRRNLELKMQSGAVRTQIIDGGFVANNPSLFALIDATRALAIHPSDVRLFSVGTGIFPAKRRWLPSLAKKIWLLSDAISLLEETLESSSNSADFIRRVMFPGVETVRINPSYPNAEFSTDLLESDTTTLHKMYSCGVKAYIRPDGNYNGTHSDRTS